MGSGGVGEWGSGEEYQSQIEELVRSHIIKYWESQDEPEHLRTIRDRLLQNQQRAGRLLGLYQQILQRGEVAGDDSSEQMELRLSGLVVKQQGLKVSNRIYAAVFNQSWVDQAFAKLRPYAQALTAWFDSDCQDESRLLRGQTLRDAQTWTVGKSLSDQDYQFLAASQQLDRQEVQIALDTERQAKQILADARQKAEIALEQEKRANKLLGKAQQKTRRQSYIGAAILGVSLLGALGVAALTEQARKNAFTAIDVERDGNYALERFQLNQIDGLVIAMQAGQTLKHLVKEKHSIVDYPAFSPIVRIQDILAEIQEKNSLEEHSSSVTSVAFSPDGKILASGSSDKTIKLWDTATGKVIRTLTGHTDSVRSVAFSPDGKILASGSSDKTIKLWNINTGKEIRTLTGHSELVSSVAFSPDGKILASGSYDKTIKLWNINTGKLIRTLTGHFELVSSVAFSPDGKTLASGSSDKTIKLWNTTTGKQIRTLTVSSFRVRSVAFSPDGKTLASGSSDGDIKLWDTSTGKVIRTIKANSSFVLSVAFSPEGKILASRSNDKTIKLWDINTGKLIRTLAGHSELVSSVAFSPDGKTLASASGDSTIKLWDTTTTGKVRTLKGHSSTVNGVAFTPDGKTLASASDDTNIKLWDATTNKLIRTFNRNTFSVNSIAFSPDGKTLAFTSYDETIKLWDINADKFRTLRGDSSLVLSVVFSPDGKTLASTSNDKTIKLWDINTGKVTRTLTGDSYVSSVVFSRDGKILASTSNDKTIKLWDINTGKVTLTLTGHSNSVTSVVFSPDGKILASGSADNTIKLWDINTGREIRTFNRHTNTITSIAFSPDGKILASGSADNTINLWDTNTGKFRTLTGHSDSVNSVAFNADGKTLASGSADNTIKLWNLDIDNLLSQGCNRLQNYLIIHPNTLSELKVCQNKSILLAAVPAMIAQGEKLGNEGNFDDAVAKFKTAKEWNPKLEINPEVRAKSLTLAFAGRELAKKGKIADAIANFKQALQLDSKIILDPDAEVKDNNPQTVANKLLASEYVTQARELANNSDLSATVAKLKQALQLDPNIDLDPYTESIQHNPEATANKLVAAANVNQARELANKGDISGGVAKFKQAVQLDSKIDLDPDTEGVQNNPEAVAKSLAATADVTQGTELANNGDFDGGVAKFKQALRLDPKIDLDPDTEGVQNNPEVVAKSLAATALTSKAEEYLKQGDFPKAVALYTEIEKLQPSKEILANSWNSLCWYGSLRGHAQDVVKDACEKAVSLAPTDGDILDSRGLARALTGDTKGAIKDFEVYIKLTEDVEGKAQRQNWVKDLRAGKNPFTQEELNKLRGE
ncbi:AAA-like domain-containing protein [Tolypothrix sp. VBCCA 56010]|uniref:WD40 domain-containing protein n=1 Tax=Tolypothrix sp. VBCCA 56010 TaxID=3137731 RepID=UPI003D7E71F9